MNCIICNNTAGFSSTKLKNGKVCKTCASKLPSLMLRGKPYLQESALRLAIDSTKENMEKFCATASYGKLHIDSIHSLFTISDKLDKDGKPKTGNNVFSVYNLSEVGIFCKSPRTDRNLVLADIEFRCTLEDPYISFSVTIKQGAKCQTKRVDSQHVEWEEPPELSMFRTLFNRMLTGAFEKVNAMLCGKTIHDFEVEKARAIFMLPEDYTAADLKKARRLLMKVYHPDKGEDDVTREAQIINEAHDILKADLERRENGR